MANSTTKGGRTYKCGVCKDLEVLDEIFASSLIKNSGENCQLCSILHRSIFQFIENFDAVHKLQLVIDSSLFIYAKDEKNQSLGIYEFYTLQGEVSPWSNIGVARNVSIDSSSSDCLEIAKGWLTECLTSHSSCRRQNKPKLPRRVVFVGRCAEDIRLVDRQSRKKKDYAALSHCWGGESPIKLNKATLKELKKRIIFDESSKTFKEAVEVTRSLGISYLWIDSLCILQDEDDLSDWELEASNMGKIFNNATVTIAAASSTGPSQGLFPDVEARRKSHKAAAFEFTTSSGKVGTIHVRVRNEDVFNIREPVHSSLEIESSHLHSRGWVLQEEQLSPRTLQFRKEELAWTCSTHSCCECRIRPSLALPGPFRHALGIEEPSKEITTTLGNYWPSMVMEFTRRELTKPSDRIAAFAGMAYYMEEQTIDNIFCGVCYEDKAFQFLWYIDKASQKQAVTSRFKTPYAPSWSWMSVPGVVNYWNKHPAGSAPKHKSIDSTDAIDSYLVVVCIGRVPVNPWNRFGPLVKAEALLYAYTIPVQFLPQTQQWQTTDYHIEDMVPSMLRTYIDVEDDEPAKHPDREHALLFAGCWKGQGITLSCFEAVCILVRRVSQHELDTALDGSKIPEELRSAVENRDDQWAKFKPVLSNSFERVGLVRNAGSIDAWRKADIPFEPVFLF